MSQASFEPEEDAVELPELFFRLCPKCHRAVPGHSEERYCINDGELLLEHCPVCKTRIRSPFAKFCGHCGQPF
jgi:hypothetical protein